MEMLRTWTRCTPQRFFRAREAVEWWQVATTYNWSLAMAVLIALLCLALMTGSELCIAVFVHPLLRSLPEPQQTSFASRDASLLGRVMPFWYGLSLVSTIIAAARLHRSGTGWLNLSTWSALIQATIILVTVTVLVPLNNRIAKVREAETGWLSAARRWDSLHRLRVGALLIAVLLLTTQILSCFNVLSR